MMNVNCKMVLMSIAMLYLCNRNSKLLHHFCLSSYCHYSTLLLLLFLFLLILLLHHHHLPLLLLLLLLLLLAVGRDGGGCGNTALIDVERLFIIDMMIKYYSAEI
ncbi:hypothetical protein Lalb_Chr06g0161601 [Lupinus albus]|uniref:Uncharacterized protein n=1 Tax=Lupinus albus TaxID=3870 RepID=A0A6A4QCJ3_LUPAL|nr:hypothetical protein Lalb_Chr06g0161601 [Lupinus albus]